MTADHAFSFQSASGLRGLEIRDQKVSRAPVDTGTDMVIDGCDDFVDDDDVQGPSQQETVHLLGDMVI